MNAVKRRTMNAFVSWLATAAVLWAPSAGAVAPDDSYLTGYAAAILQREFQVTAPSLKVTNGVISLRSEDIAGIDRQKVIAALSTIPGAVRVEILGEEAAAPAAAGSPEGAAPTPGSGPPGSSPGLPVGWLPPGHLFSRLLADPRWPHFSATYQRFLGDSDFRDVGAVSFGETVPLYRLDGLAGQVELGLQAGVFAIFDLNADSRDLINADYVVAAMGAYRIGDFSVLGRVFHQSSHLGDEFLLRSRIPRVNLSYETFDLKLSYDVLGMFRIYGGGGVLFDRDPPNLKPLWTQTGLEFRSPWPGPAHAIQPVAAIDIKNFQENEWHADFSLRAGLQFNEVRVLGRSFQLLVHYFNGNSPNGQFYKQRIKYIGLGGHFHF